MRPDYRQFKHSQMELYHYGIKRRSGRYPWGSGDRPFQSIGGKISRLNKRFEKKMNRADVKTEKLQDRANKQFNKANIQRNSVFEFRRNRADESFEKGYRLEEKKQRLEYKASKQYEKYLRKFEALDAKMDKNLKKRGLEYYNKTINNTNSYYQAALKKRIH